MYYHIKQNAPVKAELGQLKMFKIIGIVVPFNCDQNISVNSKGLKSYGIRIDASDPTLSGEKGYAFEENITIL